MATRKVQIYISAAPEDQAYAGSLAKLLRPLQWSGVIDVWHPGSVGPGELRQEETMRALERADLFVPLLSADYLASEELHLIWSRAFELHRARRVRIAPIILRDCAWQGTPFDALKLLPRKAVPVHASVNQEKVWSEIIEDLRAEIEGMQAEKMSIAEMPPPQAERDVPEIAQRLSPIASVCFTTAWELAAVDGSRQIDVDHLLAGMLVMEGDIAQQVLRDERISWSGYRSMVGRSGWPDIAPPAGRAGKLPAPMSRDVTRILELAGEMAGRRESDDVGTRDLLTAAMTLRDVSIVDRLLERGMLGRHIADLRETRIYIKRTERPWRLPVETFTIPRGGGLLNALRSAAGDPKELERDLQRALREARADEPSPARFSEALRKEILPGFAFVATSGSTLDGAALAAVRLVQRAAEMRVMSVAISLLGSGEGGLDSAEVLEAMLPAIAGAIEPGAPRTIVITTLVEQNVARAMALGPRLLQGWTKPPPGPSPALISRLEEDDRLPDGVPAPPPDVEPAPPPVVVPAPPPPPKPVEVPVRRARLSIRSGTAELSTGDASPLWKRDGLPGEWATLPLDVDGERVLLEEALERIERWGEHETIAFGHALGKALFEDPTPNEVRSALSVEPGSTLRLALDLDLDAALVPWEYLRIGGAFLLEQRVSIVRHVELIDAKVGARPLRLSELPRRTVLAWSNPNGTDDFITGESHIEKIEDAIKRISTGVDPVSRCTSERLRKALLGEVEAFHYLGHGAIQRGNEAVLLLHPEPGGAVEPAQITAERLATWVGNTRAKFVFLGACHSGAVPPGLRVSSIAYEIVRRTGIPVIAMQVAVPRDFATAFAVNFYEHVGRSLDIEQAVYLARQVKHNDRHAFGIPVLYADEGRADAVEMPKPPPQHWAFEPRRPRVALVEKADELWAVADLPKQVTELVKKAIADAQSAGVKEIPVPPVGAEGGAAAIRDAIRDLFRSLPSAFKDREDRLAQALDEQRKASRPRPLPAVQARAEDLDLIENDPLRLDWVALAPRIDDLRRRYALPRELLVQALAELASGRHLLFVGPVGTGKTSLALEICKLLDRAPLVATASADWTAFDVVGGFFPRTAQDNGNTRTEMTFRPGVFTEAVLASWEEAPPAGGRRAWRPRPGGCWLVLDEMNRADVDRALGPVFTALETRTMRLPTASYDADAPPTTETPIPKSFRVLATLNGVDRHYLFRLSDALKRRFAFIEVPATWELAREWEILTERCEREIPGAREGAAAGAAWPEEELRRFVYLVRGFQPVGTAQLLAATRFLAASRPAGLSGEVRLTQAIAGSILPGLEDAPPQLLRLLETWATGNQEQLEAALRDAAGPSDRFTPRLAALSKALQDLGEPFSPPPAPPGLDALATLAAGLARRGGAPLTALADRLAELRRANEVQGVGP